MTGLPAAFRCCRRITRGPLTGSLIPKSFSSCVRPPWSQGRRGGRPDGDRCGTCTAPVAGDGGGDNHAGARFGRTRDTSGSTAVSIRHPAVPAQRPMSPSTGAEGPWFRRPWQGRTGRMMPLSASRASTSSVSLVSSAPSGPSGPRRQGRQGRFVRHVPEVTDAPGGQAQRRTPVRGGVADDCPAVALTEAAGRTVTGPGAIRACPGLYTRRRGRGQRDPMVRGRSWPVTGQHHGAAVGDAWAERSYDHGPPAPDDGSEQG